MKKTLHTSALVLFSFLFTGAFAQTTFLADQNPNYSVSREKYMRMADSINQWHGTTVQQTYKAFDWYENKQERRHNREQFRRELRLEMARGYYPDYYNHYNYRYRNYYRPHYRGFWWF